MTADAADTWVQINGQRLCQQLMDGSYQPMPAMGFYRAKKSGGARLLSRLTAIDTIIQLILLEALTPACEKVFSPSSFGYRPGRGVHIALEQYCTLGSQYTFAAKADPRGCFDHFSYDGIETALGAFVDDADLLALAKQFVLASLHHMKLNIRNHYKNYKEASFNTALRKIYVLEKEMQECAALEQLLLLEARTKELYYDCFDGFLRKDGFTFEKRTRRPPQNEINALLSFGNMVLYGQFAAKINRSPLDVRIGFVHATNRRMESLNLDLADVYKPLLVDRTALALINRNALRKHHFTQTENGGVYLTDEGRRIFLAAMYEKQGEWLLHKGERTNYDQLMTADIQALVRYFRSGEKYVPYRQVK